MWSNNDGMDSNWRPDFPARSDKDAEIQKLKAEVEQYKKAAHEWEMNWASEREANAKLREVPTLIDYAARSRGYPTPKEWAEIVSVARQALHAAKQDGVTK